MTTIYIAPDGAWQADAVLWAKRELEVRDER